MSVIFALRILALEFTAVLLSTVSIDASNDIMLQLANRSMDRLFRYGSCLSLHRCDIDGAKREFQTGLEWLGISKSEFTLPITRTIMDLCDCDNKCLLYNTCCSDANITDTEVTGRMVESDCVTQDERVVNNNFYAITKCPTSYDQNAISQLCSTPINWQRAQPSLPYWFVTSDSSGLTYRNMYCAMCNGESIDRLQFWDLDLRCLSLNTSADTGSVDTYSDCDVKFDGQPYRRLCVEAVQTCPPENKDEQMALQCVTGPQALVQVSFTRYRNIYCAICNGESPADVECPPISGTGFVPSLRILVHPFGETCSESNLPSTDIGACGSLKQVFSSCDAGLFYDWKSQICQSLCPENFEWRNGNCLLPLSNGVLQDDVYCNTVSHNEMIVFYMESTTPTSTTYTHDQIILATTNGTNTCTNCLWTRVSGGDVTLDDSALQVMIDGQRIEVKSPLFHKVNQSYDICLSEDHGTASNNITLLGKLCFEVEGTPTTILVSISISCLIVMVIVYAVLPAVHNVPGYIVLSQVVAMLCAFITFLLREPATANSDSCIAVSVFVHYFMLASFSWSFFFAIEITQTITSVYAVNQQSCSKFIKYSVIGWTIPMIPTLIALIIDHTDSGSDLAPQYGLPQCWINSQYGLYIYFLLPVAIIFTLNLIAYIVVVVRLSLLVHQTRRARTNHREKLILIVKLFFAFGLLWIFGILSAIFRDNAGLSCLFLFVNSLSGLILLLIFVCNASVLQAMVKLAKEKTSRFSLSTESTSKSQSSQQKLSSQKLNNRQSSK